MIYEIENTRSGIILGRYEATSEAGALDAMAKDAGYADYAAVNAEVPAAEGEIVVTLVSDAENDRALRSKKAVDSWHKITPALDDHCYAYGSRADAERYARESDEQYPAQAPWGVADVDASVAARLDAGDDCGGFGRVDLADYFADD